MACRIILRVARAIRPVVQAGPRGGGGGGGGQLTSEAISSTPLARRIPTIACVRWGEHVHDCRVQAQCADFRVLSAAL
eukprot:2793337-Alexandrium_andersonii.AAC.1